MAQFNLQGCLKLLLNNDIALVSKNPIHCKLIGGNRSNGVLGFGEFCSIFPINFNKNYVRRNGYAKKVTFIASAKSNSRKPVNGNVPKGFVDESSDDFDDDDDDDFSCFRGLVLDISYRPVNVVCWKRAICLEFMAKADVLEYYDQTVNSPHGSFNIPAVLRVPHLLQVMKRKRVKNTLSRKNIFYRDDYMCQYCKATNALTIDHVIPISRGGEWEWENLVTACAKCNSKKGQKTLEEANMSLVKVPKAPKDYEIFAIPLTGAAIRMLKIRKGTPQEWHQYLPK
ncbi:Anaredoxin [Bienertia sinuspersici]